MPQIVLDATAQASQRLATAIGLMSDMRDPQTKQPRAATAAEVKEYIVAHLKQLVIQQERQQAERAISAPTAVDIT